MKKSVVYKDLETGITHYAKHNADARYKQGHRIRVYNQNCRTPIAEWIPGSNDYYCFVFGMKVRIHCV